MVCCRLSEILGKGRFLLLGIAFLSFFFSGWGCDFLYGLLQKEGAEEKEILGDFIPFAHSAKVEELQELLALYGYYGGKIDGKFGINTRKAVIAFQGDNGLTVTKFVDKQTWAKLHSFTASQLIVEGEVNVKLVQTALSNAGFPPGKIDGKMGPKTHDALITFQQAHGLKGDGAIGLKTLDKLQLHLPLQ
jgi:peptidoglycan hydrolase-like protein with peptidoglycan-binding domain